MSPQGAGLLPYRRREGTGVVAVRLDLETEGFDYRRWGGLQHCKGGDWIVNAGGETYTVDHETFLRTYRPTGSGTYEKCTTVWATRAERDGVLPTREGASHYRRGDYLVFNDCRGEDGWTLVPERFAALYEPVPPGGSPAGSEAGKA